MIDTGTSAAGTIAGGGIARLPDHAVWRLHALWDHRSAKAVLSRETKASLIAKASTEVMELF